MADQSSDQPVFSDTSASHNGIPDEVSHIDPILGPSGSPPQSTDIPTEELKDWPTEPEASSGLDQSTLKPWWKRLWLVWMSAIILAVIAGVFWYIYSDFNSNIAADHAEHQQQTPSVHEIVHVRQKLLVGTENTYKPMEFLDPTTNQLIGFDIDLAKAIAKELNVPVEFILIDFDSIFSSAGLGSENVLTRGDVDILLDSVSITSQRQQYYAFSQPYLNAGQVAIVLKTNTAISSGVDLKGKDITVAPNTTNESQALTYTNSSNILRIKDPEQQALAVIDGRVDAMLVDLTNAKGIIDNHPNLKIATDPLTDDHYGVVFSKDKSDLVDQINQILDSLEQRGIMEGLKQKWLE